MPLKRDRRSAPAVDAMFGFGLVHPARFLAPWVIRRFFEVASTANRTDSCSATVRGGFGKI
jgi:hypothetical protein